MFKFPLKCQSRAAPPLHSQPPHPLLLLCWTLPRLLGDRLKILHSIRKLWQIAAEKSKVTAALWRPQR